MPEISTVKMLPPLIEAAGAPMFLASHFQSPPGNVHQSEEVTIDVQRATAKVAIPVPNIGSDGHLNEKNQWTNKRFLPPVLKEKVTVTAWDQIRRQLGKTEYDTPEFRVQVLEQVVAVVPELADKLRRNVELQASQVLQTGILALPDLAGTGTAFDLDYKPKSTHFADAGNDWGGGSETPLADIGGLGTVVRRDGRRRPNRLIFGETAWDDFMADSDVQSHFDNRRMNLGEINPEFMPEDAMYQGTLTYRGAKYEMYTYDADYDAPGSGTATPYVTPDNVIILAAGARRDITFGDIPQIAPPDGRVMGFLPQSIPAKGIHMQMHAWFNNEGTALTVQLMSRPLVVPTAIDTHGCLNTRA